MTYLKLFRDEPEAEIPQPLPFDSAVRTWRSTNQEDGADHMDQTDSIGRVEQALNQVERTFETLTEQVDEICEPIRMSDWLNANDDGPWAA